MLIYLDVACCRTLDISYLAKTNVDLKKCCRIFLTFRPMRIQRMLLKDLEISNPSSWLDESLKNKKDFVRPRRSKQEKKVERNQMLPEHLQRLKPCNVYFQWILTWIFLNLIYSMISLCFQKENNIDCGYYDYGYYTVKFMHDI